MSCPTKAGVPLFTVSSLPFPPVIFEGLCFLFSLLCLHLSFITAIKVGGKHRGAKQHKANLYGSAGKGLNVISSPLNLTSHTPSKMVCKYGLTSSIFPDPDSFDRSDISGCIRQAIYSSQLAIAIYSPSGWSILDHEQLVLESPCLYLVARNDATAVFRDESRAITPHTLFLLGCWFTDIVSPPPQCRKASDKKDTRDSQTHMLSMKDKQEPF